MGVSVWDREVFIKQVIDEHLGNEAVYENITNRKEEFIATVDHFYLEFLRNFGHVIPKSVLTFLKHSRKTHKNRVAIFRATAKVHKTPVCLRPVVAKCGTTIEALSKWLDVEMQYVMGALPWCIKDSHSFRKEVVTISLPPGARIFTFDAVGMYFNIDLNHAIPIMREWFECYTPPPGGSGKKLSNINALISALTIVMRWNICQFGNSYFRQKIGTAMGTSCAVAFANLYFGKHERTKLLPKYQTQLKRLHFYRRFIDDVFGVWIGNTGLDWAQMVHDFNDFGILKWTCPVPKESVDFLDLTLVIVNGRIISKTYQKPKNPYLYIPPHSAHPSGVAKGWIYGILRTYWYQNSRFSDFVHYASLLYKRHVMQGWSQAVLKELFISALNKLKTHLEAPPRLEPITPTPPSQPDHNNNTDPTAEDPELLFLHLEFHPNDIDRKTVRKLYQDNCEEVLRDSVEIEKFIIAYSKPKTIGGVVAKAQLHEAPDHEVSKYIEGELR